MNYDREREIRFYAEQFSHNGSAIDDVEPEEAITELLEEVDRLRTLLGIPEFDWDRKNSQN